MAITVEQLDALDEAISSGAKEVWYGQKKVEYRSLDEMMLLRRRMAAELAGTTTPRTRRRVARYHNGL
jgi:hypothetical protein